MNQEQLKALVKEYFNLTEIKFGELYDENKAFKIVFEGDKLELGMPVKVVTAEGQEMDAPDGYHRLENGMEIKTEGSKVVEITTAAQEAKEEEMAELPAEEFPGEVTTEDKTAIADESTKMPEMMEEDKTTVEDIVSAVAEVVKREIEDVKAEMGKMKEKMEKMSAEPAAEKTLPSTKMSAESTANTAVDPVRFEMMKKLISNKIKK